MFEFVFIEPPIATTMVAQVETKNVDGEKNRNLGLYATVGACIVVPANKPQSSENAMQLRSYAANIFSLTLDKINSDQEKISILNKPLHGILDEDFVYTPDTNFVGNDRAEILVEIDGYKIKVAGNYKVVSEKDYAEHGFSGYCEEPGWWKISTSQSFH